MNIIGINGFKRVGKGETANAIERAYNGGNVKQAGFANKLKVLAGLTLGFERTEEELIALADSMKVTGGGYVHYDEPDGAENVMHDFTMRSFYQHLGTDARELFGEDFWVDQVLPKPPKIETTDRARLERRKGLIDFDLQTWYPLTDLLLITDVRFDNEARRILALGGEVWEVLRPGTASDGHASEQPLAREFVSRQIDNDSTLEALGDKVKLALEGAAC